MENDLYFPAFPDPIVDGESVVTCEDDTVSMPLWYWKKITSYVIDVEKNIEKMQK